MEKPIAGKEPYFDTALNKLFLRGCYRTIGETTSGCFIPLKGYRPAQWPTPSMQHSGLNAE